MTESVYVLMNASIPGQLKIGRTSRDVEERARELSSHTGVPTPFIVAFSREVPDASVAEAEIHKRLQHLGYRTSTAREFFAVPLQMAIEVIQAVIAEIHFLDIEYPISESTETTEEVEVGLQLAIEEVDRILSKYKSGSGSDLMFHMSSGNKLFEVSKLLSDAHSPEIFRKCAVLLDRHALGDFVSLYSEVLENAFETAQPIYKEFEACASRYKSDAV